MDHYRLITNLEHQFLRELDRRNLAGIAAMFVQGTLEMTIPGRPNPLSGTGEAAVMQLLKSVLPANPAGTYGRHAASNLIVDLDEIAGTATAQLNSSLVLIREGKPAHFMGLGRHEDELKLIENRWWFARKTIIGDVRYPPPSD